MRIRIRRHQWEISNRDRDFFLIGGCVMNAWVLAWVGLWRIALIFVVLSVINFWTVKER